MNDQIVLHETTKALIDQYCRNPSHALLITGPRGIGKTHVAQYILGTVFDCKLNEVSGYRYGVTVTPEGSSISIEQVRKLVQSMALKTTGSRAIRRFAFIEQADMMTVEAQNALLKLLEEPPEDTIIIMTTHNVHGLLPTIRSRSPRLRVTKPRRDVLMQCVKNISLKEGSSLEQQYALSGGLPGLLWALVTQNTEHPLYVAVQDAKGLLRATTFERLAMIDGLAKHKDNTSAVILALQQIARAGLLQAAHKADLGQIKKWRNILVATQATQQALAHSAQQKLALTKLMLSL